MTPREDDSNRARWDTDPTWRVVQSAAFADAPVAARRLIRRKQRSHDVEKLVSAQYGYLISFVAAQHQEGEQWDVSRAIAELAKALVKESEKPKKDFGELVRQRRKARGLPVLPRERFLPELQPCLQVEPPCIVDEIDEGRDREDDSHMRFKVAEFRVWQAHQTLEDAEQRACPPAELEALEAAYLHEMATYAALRQPQ